MKLLIGGSPCTHWSIAQTKHRETKAEGIGWELFLNYKIARDKYQPDFFLYENNKSMSSAIRAQITAELGVEPVLINSALVSAQSRQRLYWVGRRNPDGTYSQVTVEQPVDRGIVLRDILEPGCAIKEKAYTLKAQYGKCGIANFVTNGGYHADFVPVRVGTVENDARNQDNDSQQYRVYSPAAKSVTLFGNGGGLGAKTGLYAVPVDYAPPSGCDVVVTDHNLHSAYSDGRGTPQGYAVSFPDSKSPSVTAGGAHKMKVIDPVTSAPPPASA